ncbi:DUF6397 family protein [Streptomyces sp. enrichment culture]|uniref:DUF6397 family protein n=1 Tax=Streptomyces sp. enrichment culture TaxID=1795815 RepID=UPI003F568C62
MSGDTLTRPDRQTRTPGRAARELGLRRSEFDLAVHLGRMRTVPDEGGGGRRVPHTEIDRLRARPDFPQGLQESVRVVGTRAGAALMEIPATRFTRLARLGLITPVRFYLNRYRAVVWLYLAAELEEFAADENNTTLLKGRLPEGLRGQVDAGVDLRARNWRARHLGFLLRQTGDPWQRAGALASLLAPAAVAELVTDPWERSYVNRFRPERATHGAPGSPAAQTAERIMTADDPHEIAWLGSELTAALAEARGNRPAPRPAPRPTAAAPPQEQRTPGAAAPAPAPHHPTPRDTAAPQSERHTPPNPPTRTRTGLLGRLRRARRRGRRSAPVPQRP